MTTLTNSAPGPDAQSITFTDVKGDAWTLKLTVGAIDDVKDVTGHDFRAILNAPQKMADHLFGDPGRFVDVCYVLCKPQADARNLTDRDFGRRFDGGTIERATVAFMEAVADFFPRSKIAAAIRKRLPAILEKTDREMLDELDRRLAS